MSFQTINAEDFVVSADSVASTLWSTGNQQLTTFATGSGYVQATSLFLNVNQTGSAISGSETQFSIAYGHKFGSGSTAFNPSFPDRSRSRVIYGQFRNLIYGDENSGFNFGTGNPDSRDIFVINVERSRYKEKLFTGTFELVVSGTIPLRLIDNSLTATTVEYCDAGRIYDIVSGALETGVHTGLTSNGFSNGSGSYGKFLPDVGLIILNPRALALSAGNGGISMNVVETSNTSVANLTTMFGHIKDGASFKLNSEETITSDYIFVRMKNSEFNYTTNPSMISGSGDLVYTNFIQNPQTYPTTIGLYNDNNDLLAVAKMSRPLTKDFTKESLVRVKLDF